MFYLIALSLYAQSNTDRVFFKQLLSDETSNETYTDFAPDKNAIQHTTKIVSSIYRNLISSQDSHTCAFYPTCSGYSGLAIKKHGLVAGGAMTFDRLMRCHNLAPEKYTIDMTRRKLVDHVD